MHRFILFCFLSCGVFGFTTSATKLCAQTQIPSGDFENWSSPPFGNYQEPTGGWWTTLNTLKSIGGPVTVEKTTDAHAGSFAAKLTSAQWGTLLIPGLLVSGVFDIQNPSFLVQGQPFTDQPTAFKGWFKYSPVSGDSAGIAALLTHWNTSTNKRDTLAQAAVVVTNAVATWTEFNLPFSYFLSDTPDSILVALVSSGDGQNFNGQVGSALWIDDLSLDYMASARPEIAPSVGPQVSAKGHTIWIRMPENTTHAKMRMIDIQGKVIQEQQLKAGDQSFSWTGANGIYLLEIQNETQPAFHQKMMLGL